MSKYIAVLFGGAIGAVSRFMLGSLILRLFSAVFPLGTFVINISGSFLIGLLMTFFLERPGIGVNWRLFLVTGILGGFTTFSSFEWETFALFRMGAASIAFLYVAASVILGLAAAWAGAMIAGRLWPQ